MSFGEYCKNCRHYKESHEVEGCRAGWNKDSPYQPKLPEGEYHCKCVNYQPDSESISSWEDPHEQISQWEDPITY